MANNDNSLKNKVSTHIQTQLPEFIQADHPVFAKFVKLYYQFLESAEITFSEVNNYLVLETDAPTPRFLLDENNDNVVLEDSEAKFTVGETITGLISGATAKVLVDDVDDNKRLFITSNSQFILGETVNGSTSNSSGTIQTYRPNPVSSVQQLLNYTNVDATLYNFLDQFRDSFLEGIVDNLHESVDKRKLIKNIRDLYIAKGTKKGHELFFRLLLNETPQITYPNESMLRLSDGNWQVKNIIRAVPNAGLPSELIGVTIEGTSSNATGVVVSAISFIESGVNIVELELDENTQTGNFIANETIRGISTTTEAYVTLQIKQILTSSSVTTAGGLYTSGQTVKVGDGTSDASVQVETIGTGSIDDIIIDDAGINYAIGDKILFDNTSSDGKNVSAEIQLVGGGLAPETGTPNMNDDDHILMEDGSQSFYQDSYEGTKIVLETGTHGNAPGSNANEAGQITDIRIINSGNGYTTLPILDKSNKYNSSGVLDDSGSIYSTGILTAGGSGAKLIPVSNSGVGSIKSFVIKNNGFDISSTQTLKPFRHAILKDINGTFSVGATVTFQRLSGGSYGSLAGTGIVTTYDVGRQLLSINTDVDLIVTDKIISSSNNGIIANIGIGVGSASVGMIAKSSGEFIGIDGKISEDIIRIQDSNYYQDFSYVIKVGESISAWIDDLKATVHPAGWVVFGELDVTSKVSAKITPQSAAEFGYSPELASVLSGLYVVSFGRRLGTADDGTSLRVNPHMEENDSAITNTTRDVTLTRSHVTVIGSARPSDRRMVIGPTLDLLPKYAFAVPPTTTSVAIPNYPGIVRTATSNTNNFAYFNIGQFDHVRINQVSTGTAGVKYSNTGTTFDSSSETFDTEPTFKIPEEAFRTRINVPPPGEIVVST